MTRNSFDRDNQGDTQKLQVHVSPDVDYSYRDIVNIYVGQGDVVLEFGNHHRAMTGHATIANRMVLTLANAYALQSQLKKALDEAQSQIDQHLKNQQS